MLAYEVALTRLFSIVLWHHFAYMIISAAMLGYGASGTALALLKEKIAPHFGTIYISAAAGMALLMPTAFCSLSRFPTIRLELLWDTTQLAKLLGIYLADDAAVLFRRAEHRHGLVALWPGSGTHLCVRHPGGGCRERGRHRYPVSLATPRITVRPECGFIAGGRDWRRSNWR